MGGGAATGANLGGNTGNGLEGGEDGDKNGFVFQLPVKIEKKHYKIIYLCVDHVISTGRRMLKLASNFEWYLFTFLFSAVSKKRTNCYDVL